MIKYGPTELHSIINIIPTRKIYIIVPTRLKDRAERYLLQARKTYPNSRSTVDKVWTYRQIIAKTQIIKKKYLLQKQIWVQRLTL